MKFCSHKGIYWLLPKFISWSSSLAAWHPHYKNPLQTLLAFLVVLRHHKHFQTGSGISAIHRWLWSTTSMDTGGPLYTKSKYQRSTYWILIILWAKLISEETDGTISQGSDPIHGCPDCFCYWGAPLDFFYFQFPHFYLKKITFNINLKIECTSR